MTVLVVVGYPCHHHRAAPRPRVHVTEMRRQPPEYRPEPAATARLARTPWLTLSTSWPPSRASVCASSARTTTGSATPGSHPVREVLRGRLPDDRHGQQDVRQGLPAPYPAWRQPHGIDPAGFAAHAIEPVPHGHAVAARPHQRDVDRRSRAAEQVRQTLRQHPLRALTTGQRWRRDARTGRIPVGAPPWQPRSVRSRYVRFIT